MTGCHTKTHQKRFFRILLSITALTTLLSGCVAPPTCELPSPFPLTGKVMITEFSSFGRWVEIYNGTSSTVNLANYRLKVGNNWHAVSGYMADLTYTIPTLYIPPGEFAVVKSDPSRLYGNKPIFPDYDVIYIYHSNGAYFYPSNTGYIELLHNGVTVDFVSYGTNLTAPQSASAWNGANAPAATLNAPDSLQRLSLKSDTNSAADWQLFTGITPFLPSDAACRADADLDGLPDCVEKQGMTYRTLPYYDWGARPGKRDIFLEIDHMAADFFQCGDCAGQKPPAIHLETMANIFKDNGLYLHYDIGDFAQTDGDWSNDKYHWNLCGGEEVPFHESTDFPPVDASSLSIYDYKDKYMNPKRRGTWYYMLLAYNIPGAAGMATVGGSTALIGTGFYSSRSNIGRYVSHVIMHELGHNLGLQHGGFEAANYKPNYVSVMNYLYNHRLVPHQTDAAAYYDFKCYSRYYSMVNQYNSDFYMLHYSHGTGTPIDEATISEKNGIGLGWSAVDFNCNGRIDTGAYSRDLNNSNTIEVLSDSDDWGNIYIYSANNTHAPVTPSSLQPLPGYFKAQDGSVIPVDPGLGHVIHTDEDLTERTRPVVDRAYSLESAGEAILLKVNDSCAIPAP